jgi:hypothetical protein
MEEPSKRPGAMVVSALPTASAGESSLPPEYVVKAVTLGSASTTMGGPGPDGRRVLVLVDRPIDAAGLYAR